MKALAFQDALVAELVASFPNYVVSARSPLDKELVAKTLWVTFEDIETPEGIADLGQSVGISVPVYVLLIMDVPETDLGFRTSYTCRFNVIQAAQRATKTFSTVDSSVLCVLAGEAAVIANDLIISNTRINVEYQLEATA